MAKMTRYFLVSFIYTTKECAQGTGSELIQSEGMLNAFDAIQLILKKRGLYHMTINNLFEFNNELDYKAFSAKSNMAGFSIN